MTLLATRKHFIEFSGRYDLVVDNVAYADQGANFFINAGQKWLDRFGDIYQSKARHYISVLVDQWYALVPNARSVEDVYVSGVSGSKRKLEKLTFEDLRHCYRSDPGLSESGCILSYAPVVLRTVPETTGTITFDKFGAITYSDATKNHWNYTGLVFLPPSDEAITLEVLGSFYQPVLSADGDKNFWTEENEFILVLAACRALEVSYRNTAGVKDWESAILNEVQGLEFDYVDQVSTGYTQMEG